MSRKREYIEVRLTLRQWRALLDAAEEQEVHIYHLPNGHGGGSKEMLPALREAIKKVCSAIAIPSYIASKRKLTS